MKNIERLPLLILFLLFCWLRHPIIFAHSLNPKVVERLTGETVEDHDHLQSDVLSDPRGEERTYASFPEWYIVYSAQEYSIFVAEGHRPSQFPYFKSIAQYWDAADHTTAVLGDEEIDESTQTVLRFIGFSFSAEQAVIGLYEKTIGRIFEYANVLIETNEDQYTEAVAEEYGQFLLHTPWYEFPYGRKLAGLWTTYDWSSLTPRGIERRVVFTLGYSVKGMYAHITHRLSSRSLGTANLSTVLEVQGISAEQLHTLSGVTVINVGDDKHVRATAPRYRVFTSIAQSITDAGGSFLSIQDHDTIMLTVIAPEETDCFEDMNVLFRMPILTQPGFLRVAIDTDILTLSDTINSISNCHMALEHLYDY